MSGSQTPPPGGTSKDALNADPSMEDILASIRRILSEDVPQPATMDDPPASEAGQSDVLVLDSSMMVADAPEPAPEPPPVAVQPVGDPVPVPAAVPQQPRSTAEPVEALMAPEVLEAAASSVNTLVRRLSAERGTLVRSGGPTIEDLVREELRPMLKQWLDAYLPPLVERLVKAEIERVVGRVIP